MAVFSLVDFYSKQPINKYAFTTADNKAEAWKTFNSKWRTIPGFPKMNEIAENIEISKWAIIEVQPAPRKSVETQTDFADKLDLPRLGTLGRPTFEQVMKYTIYCDMDGVLSDFNLAIEQLGRGTFEQMKLIGTGYAWATVAKAGEKFWTEMSWKNDGKQLWEYIKPFNPFILSSPARNPVCFTGKRKWCENNLGLTADRIILRNDKETLATPSSILIDDTKKKLDAWMAKGGIGILHTDTANTIKQLQDILH